MRVEQQETISAPREALWPLLTDTERLNRELGLPPVRFSFLPQEGGGSTLMAEMRVSGLTLRYREEPYRWVRPEFWSVRRVFENGPLREALLGMRLEERPDGGTDAYAFAEATPRNSATLPVARALARGTVRSLLSACRGFAGFLQGETAVLYPRHGGKPPPQRERLEQAASALKAQGAPAPLVDRLAEHIARAPVEDVVQMRPFALADRWGVSRRELLRTCLLAVRAGLLELRWRILCPACRGPGDAQEHLGDMARGEAHCPSCNIHFDPEFDRSVEVCFSVAPAIRPAALGEATYCIGGPGRAPHVWAQWPLAPGEEQALTLDLTAGPCALTSPQTPRVEMTLANDVADNEISVTLRPDGERVQIELCDPSRLPARARWRIRNATNVPLVLRWETPGGSDEVATAAQVTALQEFRDAFASEVLSPGVELAVRQITILFSDLKGSTGMYRQRGDAPSYVTVRDHFMFLREIIGRHGGGIIKTIGDAVMAAFSDPADALAAALEVQRGAPAQPGGLVVKLGLHAGPALAVNANERLDYFGQTVNIAARIQNESRGGDVVLAANLADDVRIAPLLAGVRCEPFSVLLRGTSETIRLLRLWPIHPSESSNHEHESSEPSPGTVELAP